MPRREKSMCLIIKRMHRREKSKRSIKKSNRRRKTIAGKKDEGST